MAIGAGIDIAIEATNIVLMKSNLENYHRVIDDFSLQYQPCLYLSMTGRNKFELLVSWTI